MKVGVVVKEKNRIDIIVCYGPNEEGNVEEKNIFWEKLQRAFEDYILLDFNARVRNNSEKWDGVIGREDKEHENNNGRLLEFCIDNDLQIINTFFKPKTIHKITREVIDIDTLSRWKEYFQTLQMMATTWKKQQSYQATRIKKRSGKTYRKIMKK